jgi:hypothetical protein
VNEPVVLSKEEVQANLKKKMAEKKKESNKKDSLNVVKH